VKQVSKAGWKDEKEVVKQVRKMRRRFVRRKVGE